MAKQIKELAGFLQHNTNIIPRINRIIDYTTTFIEIKLESQQINSNLIKEEKIYENFSRNIIKINKITRSILSDLKDYMNNDKNELNSELISLIKGNFFVKKFINLKKAMEEYLSVSN